MPPETAARIERMKVLSEILSRTEKAVIAERSHPIDFTVLVEAALRVAPTIVGHAVVIADMEGKIIFANNIGFHSYGYASGSELVGQSITALVPERLRAKHAEGFAKAAAGGNRSLPTWTGLLMPVLCKDGTEKLSALSFGRISILGQEAFFGTIHPVTLYEGGK